MKQKLPARPQEAKITRQARYSISPIILVLPLVITRLSLVRVNQSQNQTILSAVLLNRVRKVDVASELPLPGLFLLICFDSPIPDRWLVVKFGR